jgi:hypothetical protein
MVPSMDVTVPFQRGNPAASVRRRQIFSGGAATVIATRHSIRKVEVVFRLIDSVSVSIAPTTIDGAERMRWPRRK